MSHPIIPGPETVNMRGGHIPEEDDVISERFMYGDGKSKVLVKNNLNSFMSGLWTLFPDANAEGFHIDMYVGGLSSDPRKAYEQTVDIHVSNIEDIWEEYITHLLFNPDYGWIVRAQRPRDLSESPDPVFEVPHPKEKSLKLVMPALAHSVTAQVTASKANNPTQPGPFQNSAQQFSSLTELQSTVLGGPLKGVVYGYLGKLEANATSESFLRAALILTDQYPASKYPSWNFVIDAPSGNPAQKTTLSINSAGWTVQYIGRILPYINTSQPWQLFVRRDGSVSTDLEPPKSRNDIVRICLKGSGTAYWKIPRDPKCLESCGINQIQPGFVTAMRLLCPDEPKPKKVAYVGGFYLGAGAWECAHDGFWEQVKTDAKNSDSKLKYELKLRDSDVDPDDVIIRMSGDQYQANARSNDWNKIAEELENFSIARLCEQQRPISFRIWPSMQSRIEDGHHAVIPYAPIGGTVSGLKEVLKSAHDRIIWFRPEWKIFNIFNGGGPSSQYVSWRAQGDPSLRSFRHALESHWGKGKSSTASFRIVEMEQPSSRDLEFVVTPDTSEEEWRLYVYDWLHGNRLTVTLNTDINYGK